MQFRSKWLYPKLGGVKRRVDSVWFSRFPPQICDNVAAWAVAHDIPVHTVLPERQYHWQLPNTVEPTILPELSKYQTGTHQPNYFVELRHPLVTGKFATVILPDGAYAAESVYWRPFLEENVFPPRLHFRREYKEGSYFSLVTPWTAGSPAYYHWMHDGLMRLYGVQHLLPADVHYIVPARMQPWHFATLRVLGIRPDQLVSMGPWDTWELERLYFMNCAMPSGLSDSETDGWLRNQVFAYCGVREGERKRRMYIDRSASRHRRVVNQTEILAYLKPYGFEVIAPETLALTEQAKLFSEAEIVIGPHGSGFTNIYFAPRGLILVDMLTLDRLVIPQTFYSLSQSLGQTYWYFLTEPVSRENHVPDIYVPLDKLSATLEQIGIA